MPTLFFLHALGASAREWDAVVARLRDRYDCVALDMPGFGDAAEAGYVDVAAAVAWFTREVRARRPDRWLIVGHSMGGKIATLVAAQAREGVAGLSGLAGVVLVAASPPAPEPMDEDRRRQMLGWFADGPASEAQARTFVAANVAADLPPAMEAQAVADVLRSHRQAWLGWLERGSREDWSEEAGRLPIPALILAGGEDGDLGEEAQRRWNLPHYPNGRIAVVADAAHLLPYEQPERLADLIAAHAEHALASALPAAFLNLLGSARVSAQTRRLLLERHAGPAADARTLLADRQVEILKLLIAHVLPDAADPADLARRIDVALASGEGDGWRYADLPPDASGWTMALDLLDQHGFADQAAAAREDLLRSIAEGADTVGVRLAPWTCRQWQHWFADARGEIVRQWMALPRTMARIGYDGFAVGGDDQRKQGYVRTGADDPEPWQLSARRPA